MNLVQFLDLHGNRLIGSPSDDQSILRILDRFYSVYELANQAIRTGGTLAELATQHLSDRTELYDQVIRERRLPPPVPHLHPPPRCGYPACLTPHRSAHSCSADHPKLRSHPQPPPRYTQYFPPDPQAAET